jgi:hypothetical protein
MALRYAVGVKIKNKTDQMTVEAEDALIAALKVKTAHPEAAITYVRKQNARGDRRHPHSGQIDEDPAGHAAGDAAQSRSSLQTVCGTIAEAMPDPVPKPPGRAPGEPIIIKNPPRPPEAPEIDRSLDEEMKRRSGRRRRSSPKNLRLLHPGNARRATRQPLPRSSNQSCGRAMRTPP